MSDFSQLIEMLHSNNSNIRFDACQQLRVSEQRLPQEVIDALRNAASDPDTNVANEAKRALEIQTALTNNKDAPEASISANDDWEIARWERLRDVCRGTRPNNGEFDEDELFSGPGIRPGMYD